MANGIHWMLREAAANAGVYATPETARAFWPVSYTHLED